MSLIYLLDTNTISELAVRPVCAGTHRNPLYPACESILSTFNRRTLQNEDASHLRSDA